MTTTNNLQQSDALSNIVWSEKYRPRTVDECILPEHVKQQVQAMIATGNIPSLMFSSGPGQGKTTLARAIVADMGGEMMFINASLENGIDTIRTKVMQFSSSASLEGKPKFLLFDEFDGLTRNAMESLRGIIEEFKNVRFFFTCNFRNRIIEAIVSRTSEISFITTADEKIKLQSQFFKRVVKILKAENVEFDPKAVVELITRSYPDNRKILNELQRYSAGGKIDMGIVGGKDGGGRANIAELIEVLKAKNFTEMRKWVAKNPDVDLQTLLREFYNIASDTMTPDCIPQLVITLADYGFKATHSVDREILSAAALTEVMSIAQWK